MGLFPMNVGGGGTLPSVYAVFQTPGTANVTGLYNNGNGNAAVTQQAFVSTSYNASSLVTYSYGNNNITITLKKACIVKGTHAGTIVDAIKNAGDTISFTYTQSSAFMFFEK